MWQVEAFPKPNLIWAAFGLEDYRLDSWYPTDLHTLRSFRVISLGFWTCRSLGLPPFLQPHVKHHSGVFVFCSTAASWCLVSVIGRLIIVQMFEAQTGGVEMRMCGRWHVAQHFIGIYDAIELDFLRHFIHHFLPRTQGRLLHVQWHATSCFGEFVSVEGKNYMQTCLVWPCGTDPSDVMWNFLELFLLLQWSERLHQLKWPHNHLVAFFLGENHTIQNSSIKDV